MKEIDVNYNNNTTKYKIYIGNNFDSLNSCIDEHKINEKIMIVCDLKVGDLYEDELVKRLKNKSIYLFKMGCGEKNKNLNTVNDIYEKCLENNFNRSCAIMALGGGVVGDTAGFAASSYMRGIKFIQVPTTLMADVDSSIGGKVGVNYKNVKNIIGNFYHPQFIYINTSTLKTLDNRQIISGIAEVIKYAILFDIDFFNYLNENIKGLLNLESDKLNYIIRNCINFKIRTVQNDVYDNKERQLLNFGHTMGHVIETMSNYSIYHGEAVAIGIMFECALSNVCGLMDSNEMLNIFKLINKAELGHYYDFSDINGIFNIMKHDKKVENGNMKFIIPKTIGSPLIVSDIKEDEIFKALQVLKDYWTKTVVI